jgi:hypothetical protein
MSRPRNLTCARCKVRPVTAGHGARYCEPCRAADPHRNGKRDQKQIIVMVDCEGKQDQHGMHLWTASFGREDGTSGSVTTGDPRVALRYLADHLTGLHEGQRQAVTAFVFDWDTAVLARDFDSADMLLVHKAVARKRNLLCATQHPAGKEKCGKLHRYDATAIQTVITEGGEGDVIAWDRKSNIGIAATPRRRLYIEYRPFGDRFEQRKILDIHDVGSAFTGSFEKVIDTWQPALSRVERMVIKHGKRARTKGFPGWPDSRIEWYSEAECIAGARTVRLLLETITEVSAVTIKPTRLFGSGSVAGEINQHHKVARRTETHVDPVVDLIATMTYFGGLIETPVLGRVVGQVEEDDFCSAYPSFASKLPCMRNGHGRWEHSKGEPHVSRETLGHVRAGWSVQALSTGPFVIRLIDDRVVAPLNADNVWVTMAEYQAASERFGPDIYAYEAWWWVPECDCPPPFAWMIPFYVEREKIKTRMKGCSGSEWLALNCRQEAIKLILNSAYGKLAQRRPTLGKYTNLHYASHITGSTRAALRSRTWALEDAGFTVVYQHTDGIRYLGDPCVLDHGTHLGDVKAEKPSADLLIIQPGLVAAGKGKSATRGVKESSFKAQARDWAAEADLTQPPTAWPAITLTDRRMRSRRLAIHEKKPEKAGEFYEKSLTLGFITIKRNASAATPLKGQPEAWQIPPRLYVPDELIARTVSQFRQFESKLTKLIKEGEFDYD